MICRPRLSTSVIRTHVIAEITTTATVCFPSVFWSGQIILLNSLFSPLNQLLFCFCELFFDFFLSAIKSPHRLFCLSMRCVLFAESAILAELKSLRMDFFVFCSIVISLLAFCTSERNSRAHDFHLQYHSMFLISFFLFTYAIRKNSQKKRPASMSLKEYNMEQDFCQV